MNEDMSFAATVLQQARGAFVVMAREHLNSTDHTEQEAMASAVLGSAPQAPAD
ncbi:hypothetical protein J7E93_36595 [Streptomyces sp. ISL-36]|uniref:hypothetical protein n=1 Tax=Streptomyces sp. ISL-36 TaxID=2819182 RepID=UPI001BEADFB6|nr:hypothetical protein [Streptomyces sp. ISL-36]MBT2445502.1 hypothetical protein [Streptomyces sp. ISL-36]